MSFERSLEYIGFNGYNMSVLRYVVRNKCPVSTRVRLIAWSCMGNSGCVRDRFAPSPCRAEIESCLQYILIFFSSLPTRPQCPPNLERVCIGPQDTLSVCNCTCVVLITARTWEVYLIAIVPTDGLLAI